MRDYHNLYLKSDVVILEDIFEDFSHICMKNYRIDPGHFLTGPSLAYNAALSYTRVQLELLSDPDMLLIFEGATRGGIDMISHRHGNANSPYVDKYYNPPSTSPTSTPTISMDGPWHNPFPRGT